MTAVSIHNVLYLSLQTWYDNCFSRWSSEQRKNHVMMPTFAKDIDDKQSITQYDYFLFASYKIIKYKTKTLKKLENKTIKFYLWKMQTTYWSYNDVIIRLEISSISERSIFYSSTSLKFILDKNNMRKLQLLSHKLISKYVLCFLCF